MAEPLRSTRELRRRRSTADDWIPYASWTAVGTAVLMGALILIAWLSADQRDPVLLGSTSSSSACSSRVCSRYMSWVVMHSVVRSSGSDTAERILNLTNLIRLPETRPPDHRWQRTGLPTHQLGWPFRV